MAPPRPTIPAMHRGMSVVVERVTKRSEDGRALLREVSFEAKAGEHVALVGPSGSGKSVVLQLIALMDVPSAGSIRIDGLATASFDYRLMRSHRIRTGFVPVSRGLLVNATIAENVTLPLRYHRGADLDESEIRGRVATVLGELGIDAAGALAPSDATPSIRKRALFARALILEPELLLCDEPQQSLSLEEQELVRKACERRRFSRKMTIIQTDTDGVFGPLKPERVIQVESASDLGYNPLAGSEIEL